jgi:hypothetical protein
MEWSELTPVDFFCGGFVKHSVYVTAPTAPVPATTNDTTPAQQTDQGGLYKN